MVSTAVYGLIALHLQHSQQQRLRGQQANLNYLIMASMVLQRDVRRKREERRRLQRNRTLTGIQLALEYQKKHGKRSRDDDSS